MTGEPTLQMSLDEAQQESLAHWLSQVHEMPMVITEQGSAVGVIMSPSAYAHLRRIQAYFEMVRLSRSLQESGLTADELFRMSREEAEVR